jgi:hypothetical protein
MYWRSGFRGWNDKFAMKITASRVACALTFEAPPSADRSYGSG